MTVTTPGPDERALRARAMPGSPSFQGAARRLLGRFYFVGPFWYWFQHWGMRILPESLKRPMTAFWVTLFFFCLFRARRGITQNLDVVLGRCGFFERQRRIYRVFHAWAWCRNERYEAMSDHPRPVQLDIEGGQYFKELAAHPDGFMVLAPHVGNFEIGNMLPVDLLQGRRLHVVRREEPVPASERWVRELIAKHVPPQIVMHTISDDVDTGVVLLHALRRGDLVSMGCDRPPPRGRNIQTNVCGQPFQLPTAPLRLMRAASVPAVMMCMFREGRSHYRLVVLAPFRVEGGDLHAAAERVGKDLEWAIRERPSQWFTFGGVWSDTARL